MEQKLFPDWRGLLLLGAGLTYLLLTPGQQAIILMHAQHAHLADLCAGFKAQMIC